MRRFYRGWAGAVSEGLAMAVVVAVLEEYAIHHVCTVLDRQRSSP